MYITVYGNKRETGNGLYLGYARYKIPPVLGAGGMVAETGVIVIGVRRVESIRGRNR